MAHQGKTLKWIENIETKGGNVILLLQDDIIQHLFIPFPNSPWFLRVCSISLLKTLWEKEKLLITSNFSISHSFFYLLGKFLPFSSNLELLSAISFTLEESKICRFMFCMTLYHYFSSAYAFSSGKAQSVLSS